jgi:hypothetical protein
MSATKHKPTPEERAVWTACINAVQDEFFVDLDYILHNHNDPQRSNVRAFLIALARAYIPTWPRSQIAKRLGMKHGTHSWALTKRVHAAVLAQRQVVVPRMGAMAADVVWRNLRNRLENSIKERTVAA